MTLLAVTCPWNERKPVLRTLFYWPSLAEDCRRYIQTCRTCQMKARVTYRDRVPITPIPRADRVFDHWFIDCAGPFFPGQKVKLQVVKNRTRASALARWQPNCRLWQEFHSLSLIRCELQSVLSKYDTFRLKCTKTVSARTSWASLSAFPQPVWAAIKHTLSRIRGAVRICWQA